MGLRAGYVNEAARQGRGCQPEAMHQSQHRSTHQVWSYYNDAKRRVGGAAGQVRERFAVA